MLELLFVREYEPHIPLNVALARHKKFQVLSGPVVGQSAPIIDGFELLLGRSARVSDPYWGKIRRSTNGWCFSPWFGVFDDRQFPLIFHSELGWLISCTKKGDDGYLFYSNYLGEIWTSAQCFPYVYDVRQKSWLKIDRTISVCGGYPGCGYYNVTKKVWSTLH